VVHQAVSSIETHNFAVGHDLTNRAVENALTTGTANEITAYVDLLAGLAIMVGMIAAVLNALRVGLLPRWMGILGIFSGVLIFLPLGGETLEVIPAFWMVMMGLLYVGKWPSGDPPAWPDGEARPWVSRSDWRTGRGERNANKGGVGQPALSAAGSDVAPPPSQPASLGSSRKRRRKRGTRG
jgi:hypothetical protein